jgi:serine/threonine protein kinase/Tfp pilus assembly protein PilF
MDSPVTSGQSTKNMDLPQGTLISNYRIISKLGEGGMGEVFLAEDPTLERKLAIKMLTNECCENADRLGRFMQEAKAASALNHPNIITIFEFGIHRETHFIATEFIDGRELSHVLAAETLPLDEVLDIAIQIASALTSAHAAGIIHRDIKPENIMVRSDGIVKILDFGLAKLTNMRRVKERKKAGKEDQTLIAVSPLHTDSASPKTIPGLVMGTPKYMSPEQARGIDLDQRTDIFSFGVVLYEMLTNTQPFDGETISDVIAAVLTRDPRPLREVKPELPQEIEKIVDKLLRKQKRERYQTASDLFNDLDELKQELQALRRLERTGKTNPGIRHGLDSKTYSIGQPDLRNSIAVLPFVNMSTDQGHDYFSEGLTEEIIMNLSKVQMLRVVPRGSTVHFVNEGKTHKEMADALDAQYLLEGSVRRQGKDLRITAQLVDTDNQAYLWSETYRGTIKDVFEIQEKVATEIVLALQLRLSPDEKQILGKRYTENTEAYQLYLQGRFFWNKRDEDGLKTAIIYFEKAIEMDQQYALAWAGIADSYTLLGEFGTIQRKELYPLAAAAVKRALEIDDQLAEVHTSFAILLMLNEWDWVNSKREFKRALELNPNYATAHHWYSLWFLSMGDLEKSTRMIQRASELDPVSQAIIKDIGMARYYDKQYDDAIEMAKKTLELAPDYPAAHRLLSLTHQAKGQFDEAIAENRIWGDLTGNRVETKFCLAQIYAVSGRREEAKSLAEEVKRQSGIDNIYRGLALIHVGIGEDDIAFDMLEKSFDLREESLLNLKVDPKLERLRSDPRFAALLRKMGVQ